VGYAASDRREGGERARTIWGMKVGASVATFVVGLGLTSIDTPHVPRSAYGALRMPHGLQIDHASLARHHAPPAAARGRGPRRVMALPLRSPSALHRTHNLQNRWSQRACLACNRIPLRRVRVIRTYRLPSMGWEDVCGDGTSNGAASTQPRTSCAQRVGMGGMRSAPMIPHRGRSRTAWQVKEMHVCFGRGGSAVRPSHVPPACRVTRCTGA
jgi:hypothetical protein